MLGYKNCSCDIALDVDDDDKFVLYTVAYRDENETEQNDITLVGLFEEHSIWSARDDKAPEGAGDYFGIACKFISSQWPTQEYILLLPCYTHD